MHKDVIYIDTEDDITAIIGKIKASHEKIVALVPPKRIGILQSAVNLRLLARMAETSNKHLVIITNNRALIALSAASMIPIAKNLQSKPEIAEVEELEVDEGEDIIEGTQLPIGELARTADIRQTDNVVDDVVDTIDVEDASSKSSKSLSKSAIKVPNFSDFRKKFFIGGLIAILLIGFFVWAIIFAPSAKVIITAKTSSAPVSIALKLGGTTVTDISKNIVQTVSKQIKKDVSVQFDATGTKDLGEKSTGTILIENCDDIKPIPIGAGTVFMASSGERFVNTSPITVPGLSGKSSDCQKDGTGAGTINVAVTAEKSGASYNIAAKNYSITGIDGFVYAHGGVMAGGTTKIATVVTADDIQKASQALVDMSSDDVKQQLVKQFTSEFVIADSFSIDRAAAVSVPAVDTEATGKAKLTSATTYTMVAIAKSEIQAFLDNNLNQQIVKDNKQRIYDNGISNAKLSGYFKSDQGATINVSAVGQIGPSIDKESVKQQVRGKRYGEVQTLISNIQGVDNVDIKFSYFWVNTVPDDITKIDVEFQIQNG